MQGGSGGAEERLEAVRRQLQRWRRGRRGHGGRIPNELWEAAAEAAELCGVETTAARLQLNPVRLQQWCDRRDVPSERLEPSPFVELPPFPVSATAAECALELEEPSGRKLRIVLKGQATAQVIPLSQVLWRAQR